MGQTTQRKCKQQQQIRSQDLNSDKLILGLN